VRIVGGKHRSRVLKQFDGLAVRPTSDKVRESLFNILRDIVPSAKVLDLFAGTGAVGLESLSRGAKSVTFTDNSAESLKIVKDNLSALKESAEVIKTDAIAYLERTTDKFDFIFIDPPYNSGLGVRALEIIAKRGLLTEDGVAVYEDDATIGKVKGLFKYDERKYGRANLAFFKTKKSACGFAGTFDPITLGHYDMVMRATDEFEKVFVVLMVNPNKTPYFSKEQRLSFMQKAFEGVSAVVVDSHEGLAVDYLKKVGTPYYIRGIRTESDLIYEQKNEELSKQFYPELQTIYYKAFKSDKHLNSTMVRDAVINGEDYGSYLPKGVFEMVKKAVSEK
jgi:16S rRNA (guanine(966)-N(2))-methyltransferase RsmD/pantetheine-phosphate adenylyltransferase